MLHRRKYKSIDGDRCGINSIAPSLTDAELRSEGLPSTKIGFTPAKECEMSYAHSRYKCSVFAVQRVFLRICILLPAGRLFRRLDEVRNIASSMKDCVARSATRAGAPVPISDIMAGPHRRGAQTVKSWDSRHLIDPLRKCATTHMQTSHHTQHIMSCK